MSIYTNIRLSDNYFMHYSGDMIDVFDNECKCILGYEDRKFPFLRKGRKGGADAPGTAPQTPKYGNGNGNGDGAKG